MSPLRIRGSVNKRKGGLKMGSLKKYNKDSKKKLSAELMEKEYQIIKEAVLERLDRKGLLIPGWRTKH